MISKICGGGEGQPDAMRIAVRCGLQLMPSERRGAMLRGLRVYYDARAKPRERRRLVARCVARWALTTAGLAATDANVVRVARAIVYSLALMIA